MGRRNSLGSLKSFVWLAPQLSGASMLCFTSWVSSELSKGSSCSLMAAGWQVFLPPWVPSGLTSSPSVIADDNDICLLIWQSVFHLSPLIIWSGGGLDVFLARHCSFPPPPSHLPSMNLNLSDYTTHYLLFYITQLPLVTDWKRSVFILIPKKGNAKECSNHDTIALISHTGKVLLKILQARLQQYMNCEIPDVQARVRKGRGTKNQIANIGWIIKKREFQKNIYFCFIDYTKAFDCVDHNKLWEILKDNGKTRPPDLPPDKSVCRSTSNS